MKLRVLLPCIGLAGVIPLVYIYLPRPISSEEISATESWHPTHMEIVTALGRSQGSPAQDQRHTQFAHMFQQRYRSHDHAIGIKFLPNGRIKAMFAPLISRWDMATVSVDVFNEARDLFGQEYDVDIYETYITAPMKKLAEVRPGRDGRLTVQFDPKFAFEPSPEIVAFRANRLRPGNLPHSIRPSEGFTARPAGATETHTNTAE